MVRSGRARKAVRAPLTSRHQRPPCPTQVDVFGGRGSPMWDEFLERMVSGIQACQAHSAEIMRNVEMLVSADPISSPLALPRHTHRHQRPTGRFSRRTLHAPHRHARAAHRVFLSHRGTHRAFLASWQVATRARFPCLMNVKGKPMLKALRRRFLLYKTKRKTAKVAWHTLAVVVGGRRPR